MAVIHCWFVVVELNLPFNNYHIIPIICTIYFCITIYHRHHHYFHFVSRCRIHGQQWLGLGGDYDNFTIDCQWKNTLSLLLFLFCRFSVLWVVLDARHILTLKSVSSISSFNIITPQQLMVSGTLTHWQQSARFSFTPFDLIVPLFLNLTSSTPLCQYTYTCAHPCWLARSRS